MAHPRAEWKYDGKETVETYSQQTEDVHQHQRHF